MRNEDYYNEFLKQRKMVRKIDFIIRIVMISYMTLFLIISLLLKIDTIYRFFSTYIFKSKTYALGIEIYFQFINLVICNCYIILVLILNKIFDLYIEKKHLLFTFLISIAIFIITFITFITY